jgi:FtsH-binding integral membrane protein
MSASSASLPSPEGPGYVAGVAARDQARELLGQVMGFVAVPVGFTALGAYVGRDLSGVAGVLLFIGAFACVLALSIAAAVGREHLAIALLFGLGLLLGLAVAPVIADHAERDPSALWQAAGATATFVAGLGAYGYARRRDLSNGNVIYAVAGLAIFGGFTIFDFNGSGERAKRAPC